MVEVPGTRYVFVSHTSSDRAAAEAVVAHLGRAGITCWIASRDVTPGVDFTVQLTRAIKGASAFVVCISDEANKSIYVAAETEMGFNTCPIFPVRLADVVPEERLALPLRLSQWTDAFGPGRKRNLDRLATAIGALFGNPVAPPPPSPPPSPAPSPPLPPSGDPVLPEDEALRLFVGPNAHRFAEKWRAMDRYKRSIGWNFPAFFLGGLWFLYRKMWGWGAGLLLAATVLGAFNVHASIKDDPAASGMCSLLALGVGIFAALRADGYYREQAGRLSAAINNEGMERQRTIDRLMVAGGTSLPALLGGIAACLVVLFMVVGASSQPTPVPTPDDTNTVAVDNMTMADDVGNDSMMATNTTDASMASGGSCPVPADRHITVNNRSSRYITKLFAYNRTTGHWTVDMLGSKVLSPGSSIEANWDDGTCTCPREFRVYYDNSDAFTDYDPFDVCTHPAVDLGTDTSSSGSTENKM